MIKTPKQPVKQRIKDIALCGFFILGSSFLYGKGEIFTITFPLFLILAFALAIGRYKRGKIRIQSFLEDQEEDDKRIYSRCKNFANRKHLLGY